MNFKSSLVVIVMIICSVCLMANEVDRTEENLSTAILGHWEKGKMHRYISKNKIIQISEGQKEEEKREMNYFVSKEELENNKVYIEQDFIGEVEIHFNKERTIHWYIVEIMGTKTKMIWRYVNDETEFSGSVKK